MELGPLSAQQCIFMGAVVSTGSRSLIQQIRLGHVSRRGTKACIFMTYFLGLCAEGHNLQRWVLNLISDSFSPPPPRGIPIQPAGSVRNVKFDKLDKA